MRLFELGKRLLQHRKGQQKLVAFCLRKGKIVSVGFNSYVKTHPYQAKLAKQVGQPKREYLHAEIAALVKSQGRVDSICIVRLSATNTYTLARPCPVCMEAIRLKNPKMEIFHS